ncbi:MAG: SDR family oxidoreductase [Candidatus Aenigmatarchaeota archaeon]
MNANTKIAVITGGSKGIGKAITNILSKHYIVVNLSRSKSIDSAGSFFIKTNVSKEISCKRAFDKIKKKFGHIDLLVNCAGVLYPDDHTNTKFLASNFGTNMFGTFYCCHFAAKLMKKGQIVNISSTSGICFREGQLSYCGSKWAIVGFSGVLRLELQKKGIDVICFCPGGTKTQIFRHFKKDPSKDFMPPEEVATKIEEAMDRHDKNKWLFIYTRKERLLKSYGFNDYPLP